MQIVHILSKQRTWSVLTVFGLMLMALWFSTQGYNMPTEIPNTKNFETFHNATLLAQNNDDRTSKYVDFAAQSVQLDSSSTDGKANNCSASVPFEISVLNNGFSFRFPKKDSKLPALCMLKFKNPNTQNFEKITHFTVDLRKDMKSLFYRDFGNKYTIPFSIDAKHFKQEGVYQIMCVVNYSPEDKRFLYPELNQSKNRDYINNFTLSTFAFRKCQEGK